MTSKTCMDCKYFEWDEYYDDITFDDYECIWCDKGHHEKVGFDEEPCEDFEEDA